MAKLTKKQREVFERFARNILVATLVQRLQEEGTEIGAEDLDKINKVVDTADVSSLTQAAGEKMLELVEFPVFVKVEKFLTSPDAKQALYAAQQVGIAVQEEVYEALNEIFGETPAA